MVDERTLDLIGAIFVIVVGGFVLFALNLGSFGEGMDSEMIVGISLVIGSAGLFLVGGLAWNALSDS